MLYDVRDCIRRAGATVVELRHDGRVDALWKVQLDSAAARFAVEYRPRAPYPSELTRLESTRIRMTNLGGPLFAAPYVSEGVGMALGEYGWSWADEQGNLDIKGKGLRLKHRVTRSLPPHRQSGFPRSGGGLLILRLLVSQFAWGTPRTGDLARIAKVSQPRASQVLGQLERLDLVERGDEGWVPNREALIDAFLSEYRGPGGQEYPYYALDAPLTVATKMAGVVGTQMGVSADVGPDLLAPWRRPTQLVVYVRNKPDVHEMDLSPAQGRADATVLIRHPADGSVFTLAPFVATSGDGKEIPLADSLQMLWDLKDLGGDDRLEAADKLRAWILKSP